MKLLGVLALVSCCAGAADISGSWRVNLIMGGEEVSPARMELKVDGEKVSGSLNELTLTGSVKGSDIKLTATRPNGESFGDFTARFEGGEIRGDLVLKGDRMSWVGRRLPALSTAPPRTHTFEPKVFHRQFAGTIAPALHINPGDTVKTWTVDAGGRDASGKRLSAGGNPETGPFYVEGAQPGDTLVVKFNRIRLNRDSAGSGDRLVPDALGPYYLQSAKYDDKFDSEWKLDREAGYAMLAKPSEHLKNFKIPLRPMLGCVAVAPPDKQAFRSGWLGSYGGNMDYNGLREGTTLYLPVYQEGALLFVGDGHAAQGDGELTGDALETSMDVEFTVTLLQGKSTGGPRAENDEFIMAMGIANSLPEALRQATTQLARWVESDYKLTPNESAMVLGTSIRYDIAEIVDPQVHIVAKLPKSVLKQL